MIDLRGIRHAAGASLAQVAAALGYAEKSGKSSVVQLERRDDLRVSTLSAYIKAVGATGEVVVWTPNSGEVLRFEL